MLKKVFLLIVLSCALFLPSFSIDGNASSVSSLTSTTFYTTGENKLDYNNQEFIVDSFTDDYLFSVTGVDTKLTIKNLNITTKVGIDALFYVGEGSSLILENVKINAEYIIYTGILNYGKVTLDEVEFSDGIVNSIVNYSDNDYSIGLHTVKIKKIVLNSGFITVFEDTDVVKPIEIELSSAFVFDDSIGKKLVSGDNTFAKFYINDFYLKNTPNRKDYTTNNTFDIASYLTDIENDYYMDYVGDVGDGFLNDFNEKINTGDLILTKYEIHFGDTEKTYLAGKYCTADLFLQLEHRLINITTKYYREGLIVTDSLLLDNSTALVGVSGGMCMLGDVINSEIICITLNIKESGSATLLDSKKFYVAGGYSVDYFYRIPYTYDSYTLNGSDITITKFDVYGNNILFTLNSISSSTDCTLDVFVNKNENKVYELFLEDNSLEYSGKDLTDEISIYYLVDEEKVYLDKGSYAVKYNGEDSELINVGDYEIVLSKIPDGIEFVSTVLPISVTHKNISVNIEGEYFYSGYNQKSNIKLYYNFDGKVYLDSSDFVVKKNGNVCDFTNAGTYQIVITKVFDNFTLTSSEISIVMNKQIIDTQSQVVFEDKIVYYDGQPHSIFLSGINDHLIRVEYTGNGRVNAGENSYLITASLMLVDIENYILTESVFTANLTILKIDVDMSGITFSGVNKVYDGNAVDVEINGDLPEFVNVEYEYYLNGSKLNNQPVNVGTYLAVAKFTLISDNFFNYNKIDNMFTNIKITPKSIDCIGVEFNGKVVNYNGELHCLQADNVPDNVVCKYTYSNKPDEFIGAREIGSYVVILQLSPVSDNYVLYNYYVQMATLTIDKGIIDMSGVKFDDCEFVYDGKIHSPELSGNLPSGVTVSIDYVGGSDAGEYIAIANFTTTDENYFNPNSMTCKVVITKRPISVIYTNHYLLGNSKSVDIDFSGMLDGDDILVNVSYTKLLIGKEYYLNINLSLNDRTNYFIEEKYNNKQFKLNKSSNLFEKVTTLSSYKIDSNNSSLKYCEDNSLEISSALNSLNKEIVNYEVINIYNNSSVIEFYESELNMDIKYLKVYGYRDNSLQEIKYDYRDGKLIINCDEDMSLVFVKLDNHLTRNVIILVIFLLISFVPFTIILVMFIKNKKTYH